jgi:hypothetical protein
MPAYSVVSFSATEEILNRYMGEAGEAWTRKSTNDHCQLWRDSQPSKIEYNFIYFIMTSRMQIRQKKFGKNGFCTLQGTMFHRPLAHSSSLKITGLKVHKNENFFGFDFEICTFS